MDFKDFYLAESNQIYNSIKTKDKSIETLQVEVQKLETTPLLNIAWIWEVTAKKLMQVWINSLEDIKKKDIEFFNKLDI